jgi:hypothetical protein
VPSTGDALLALDRASAFTARERAVTLFFRVIPSVAGMR